MFVVGNSGGPESPLVLSMAAIVQCGVGWRGCSGSLICAYVWAKSKTVLCSLFSPSGRTPFCLTRSFPLKADFIVLKKLRPV